MKEILNRRSIRRYKDRAVEKEKIEKLLRAAMQAPSAGNQQPWEFIVVQDKETLNKLSQMSPYSKLVVNAPLALVLLANEKSMKYPEYWEQDMSATAENILLEAVALELGAVWLGAAPLKERMNYIRGIFKLKDNIIPFSIIAVGYSADGEENKFIDRYDEERIHYEQY